MVDFLRRKGRLYELLLCAWGEVEFNVDQLVASKYGLHGDDLNDRRVRFLLDWPFGRKLDFLRDVGAINKDEYRAIHAFQEHRNKLSHREGWHIIFMMNQDERKKLMDEAVEVSTLSLHMLFRPRTERVPPVNDKTPVPTG